MSFVTRDEKTLKPLLFPAFVLNNEVEINGHVLIPIMELAKIAFPMMEWHMTGSNEVESNTGAYFTYNEEMANFAINGTITNEVFYQVSLFDKLDELFIDYRNLIGRGLAISALDCPINPYK